MDRMIKALEMAAKQFRFYAESHSSKGTEDGDKKARVNIAMAEVMEEALKNPSSPPATVHLREIEQDAGSFLVTGVWSDGVRTPLSIRNYSSPTPERVRKYLWQKRFGHDSQEKDKEGGHSG